MQQALFFDDITIDDMGHIGPCTTSVEGFDDFEVYGGINFETGYIDLFVEFEEH